jgi:kumamolisin
MDIEIAGAIANKADIVVYFAPNTDRGFIDALNAAVYDKDHNNTVISISWGAPENSFTEQARSTFEYVLAAATNKGISVFCASGDNGSSDGVDDGQQHVDFPSSCPHAIACGGTTLITDNQNLVTKEKVWNNGEGNGATGGGISDFFARPKWQQKIRIPPSANNPNNIGRAVPDVSAVADPETGYVIYLYDNEYVSGGTSAVAPLWAAFKALLNNKYDMPSRNFNSVLYEAVKSNPQIFHDIQEGNNGRYSSLPGWDACTGLGTPNGRKMKEYFDKVAAKQVPKITGSNNIPSENLI